MPADDILAGNKPSGELLSRRRLIQSATIVTDQSGIGAGPTDLTNLTVTFTALANRVYECCTNVTGVIVTASAAFKIEVFLDGVRIGRAGYVQGAAGDVIVTGSPVLSTPSSGSRTYKLVATRDSGTGTLTIAAASGETGVFYAKDIGAA